jgi:hypothetical protein
MPCVIEAVVRALVSYAIGKPGAQMDADTTQMNADDPFLAGVIPMPG